MAQIEISCNHHETTGQEGTRKVLPISAIQKGSAVETNCSSHEVPNNKNYMSSEDQPAMDKLNVMNIHDTNEVVRNREEDELQPQGTEEEQDRTAAQRRRRPGSREDTTCGIGHLRPQCLQKLASKKTYVLVYGLIGTCNLAAGSYFVATISTIEKRFKIPSRTSGMIMSAWDVGVLSSTLAMSYLGSRGHKTRWVACGTFLIGVASFLQLTPHLIFGPGQDALDLTTEYGATLETNISNTGLFKEKSQAAVCRSEFEDDESCASGRFSSVPTTIFLVAFFLIGVGNSVYHTLGISYLDDNIRKDKTPILLAIWQCIRMLGPTVGYLYGSYALQKYVAPSVHPTITSEDPRWIGAWWHAWGPFGAVFLCLALAISLFPKKLPRAAQRAVAAPDSWTRERSFRDFKVALRRLLKNKVLIFNSLSTVFFMCGFTGYWTFMPKYMETQFRQSASRSSLITGSMGLIFSALGIMASGAVISRFKPRPRYLAGWNVFVEVLEVIGHLSYGFLTCTVDDLHGQMKPDHSWDLTADCNSECACGPTVKYSPVCAIDGSKTFYSACHAGCTTAEIINGTQMYGNCSCIGSEQMGWAVDGACPVDCTTNLIIFLVIQCTLRFFSASGRAGNIIIQFRCVDEDDKSLSISFTEALLCALAFIPGPILYGMLLDSACIVWGHTCGQRGNCWLYDGQRLGFLLNFTASGFLVGGTLVDIGVWYFVKGLQIYDTEDETGNARKKRNKRRRNGQENATQLNQPDEYPLF